MVLATPDPSQIPWMRIKPPGSRWEVMNLPSLLHGNQGWFYGVPSGGKPRSRGRAAPAHSWTKPAKHLDLTSSSPWLQQLQKIPFSLDFWLLCVIRAAEHRGYLFISSELRPGRYRMSPNPSSRLPGTEATLASPLQALPITQSHAGTFHPEPATKAEPRAPVSCFLTPWPLSTLPSRLDGNSFSDKAIHIHHWPQCHTWKSSQGIKGHYWEKKPIWLQKNYCTPYSNPRLFWGWQIPTQLLEWKPPELQVGHLCSSSSHFPEAPFSGITIFFFHFF